MSSVRKNPVATVAVCKAANEKFCVSIKGGVVNRRKEGKREKKFAKLSNEVMPVTSSFLLQVPSHLEEIGKKMMMIFFNL